MARRDDGLALVYLPWKCAGITVEQHAAEVEARVQDYTRQNEWIERIRAARPKRFKTTAARRAAQSRYRAANRDSIRAADKARRTAGKQYIPSPRDRRADARMGR